MKVLVELAKHRFRPGADPKWPIGRDARVLGQFLAEGITIETAQTESAIVYDERTMTDGR